MAEHSEDLGHLREVIARALIVDACCEACEPDWESWLPSADAVLDAIAGAGWTFIRHDSWRLRSDFGVVPEAALFGSSPSGAGDG